MCRFTHLQHTPFEYTIKVNNDKSTQVRGTMRIFLAPKFNENGEEFKFAELRLLMIEMDRFTVNSELKFDFCIQNLIKHVLLVEHFSASW